MSDLIKITDFLQTVGFAIVYDDAKFDSFVPGVLIEGMTLRINPKIPHPGDILHEAGHVAIVPSMFRNHLTNDLENSLESVAREYMDTHDFMVDFVEDPIWRGLLQASEAEAQAWSYAAAIKAGVTPKAVFHSKAYEGNSKSLILRFSLSEHIGVHGLQAAKMTTKRSFPEMLRWLQI